jgi:hypothetical protein
MVKTAQSIGTNQEFVTGGYWLRVAYARCSWPVRNFNRQKSTKRMKAQRSAQCAPARCPKKGGYLVLVFFPEKEGKRKKEQK